MIVTKAYITEMPKDGDNIFKVNVPLMSDNTLNDAIFDALLCTDPISYSGYSVGDPVFVTFEDEKYNIAIILGKLFVSIPTESKSYTITNELRVTGQANLPPSTKFGEYTVQDFTNLYNATLNSGGGSLDKEGLEKYLKEYVKWESTEEIIEEEPVEVFANKILCMSGETYSLITPVDNTLYFLTSVPTEETQ